MINDNLRRELVDMRAEDMRVRQELLEAGELGGPYVPRMEAVHKRNAARLRELIAAFAWPGEARQRAWSLRPQPAARHRRISRRRIWYLRHL